MSPYLVTIHHEVTVDAESVVWRYARAGKLVENRITGCTSLRFDKTAGLYPNPEATATAERIRRNGERVPAKARLMVNIPLAAFNQPEAPSMEEASRATGVEFRC